MKNIYDILSAAGIEIPEEKKAAINKDMMVNYKTIAEVENIQEKLTTAQGELKTAKASISDYEIKIKDLKDGAADADGLNKKITDLEKQIADRKAADEQAVKDKATADRFGAAIGEKKFLNDFTRDGILGEFKKALDDKANEGKADADVFAAIIKDREGLFENPNPLDSTPGANGNVTLPGAATNDQLSKMSYEEYKAFRSGKKE